MCLMFSDVAGGLPATSVHDYSVQNWKLPRNAIIRTDVSPPKPEPRSPVAGAIVLLIVPKLTRVLVRPGIPACGDPDPGKPKFG